MAVSSSGKRSFYTDLDDFRSHFDSLDQDKTGYIGYNELKQLVQKMSNDVDEEEFLRDLMAKLDRDNDGKVSRKGVDLRPWGAPAKSQIIGGQLGIYST